MQKLPDLEYDYSADVPELIFLGNFDEIRVPVLRYIYLQIVSYRVIVLMKTSLQITVML